jgi:hypothetical protein
MGMFSRGAMTQSRYLEEILSETRRQNAMLAVLVAKIDARLSQLEAGGRDVKKLKPEHPAQPTRRSEAPTPSFMRPAR